MTTEPTAHMTADANNAEATQWRKQRAKHGADGPSPPDRPLQLDRIPTSELKAAYDKEVEDSYDWIVPAFGHGPLQILMSSLST
jgi:hypothetical protein